MTAGTLWLIMCGAALGILWGLYLIDRACNIASNGKRARVERKIDAAPMKFSTPRKGRW